ncbi:hypothetical protein PIROE2DRAFT_7165 [Piromyces sp. E2]|nr:hypothetical protein PIROE2DRAFT_7165 [Piromyces sp. E2]|eukprot:OUM65750.1 hypothetical protein PIROE2DRAFT_7165 [Piromyces sp. E2]
MLCVISNSVNSTDNLDIEKKKRYYITTTIEFEHYYWVWLYTDEDCKNTVICRKYNANGYITKDGFAHGNKEFVRNNKTRTVSVKYRVNSRCLVGNEWMVSMLIF